MARLPPQDSNAARAQRQDTDPRRPRRQSPAVRSPRLRLGFAARQRRRARAPARPRRRANYEYLKEALDSRAQLSSAFLSSLPTDGAPLAFPLFAPTIPDFHKRLRAEGIPAFAWDGVIHSKLPLGAFPDAAFLFRSLVLLPLHQGLGYSDLDTMIGVVDRQLR